eukprot:CAMPEP_0119310870 /NCGR_PEP_ID=MMETSP1333-20130426/20599_1 /TAXON_ID=418940 /ORGANISM="Scyphosphaera apsteinii, Strain RCC1455" /LENGTH=111 /DNA_ID=CAMNT_0007315133 /DNA_START=79 /DNA_END=414 /DNA_ORIENTATION=+
MKPGRSVDSAPLKQATRSMHRRHASAPPTLREVLEDNQQPKPSGYESESEELAVDRTEPSVIIPQLTADPLLTRVKKERRTRKPGHSRSSSSDASFLAAMTRRMVGIKPTV